MTKDNGNNLINRKLARTLPGKRLGPNVSIAGWSISIFIHSVILLGCLMVSFTSSGEQEKIKQIPQAMIEPVIEPLQVEPMLDDHPLEVNLWNDIIPNRSDFDTIHQAFQPPDNSGDSIGVFTNSGNSRQNKSNSTVITRTYQSSFCGTWGHSSRICFVVDCSGSMVIAFDYIRRELKRSINALEPGQYFNVIFFASDNPRQLVFRKLLRANASNRQKGLQFVDTINLTKVSNSREALTGVINAFTEAFAGATFDGEEVNLIYLLTDGEFDHGQVTRILKDMQTQRKEPVTINVIACGVRRNERFLGNLALSYQGQYRFISDEQLAESVK
ncbi:MAG: VWA domain-containing protein [Sedimentisphaerales bacterium]|nr:VWA domain-containing protein [Sedimentisphaerales bacterium]